MADVKMTEYIDDRFAILGNTLLHCYISSDDKEKEIVLPSHVYGKGIEVVGAGALYGLKGSRIVFPKTLKKLNVAGLSEKIDLLLKSIPEILTTYGFECQKLIFENASVSGTEYFALSTLGFTSSDNKRVYPDMPKMFKTKKFDSLFKETPCSFPVNVDCLLSSDIIPEKAVPLKQVDYYGEDLQLQPKDELQFVRLNIMRLLENKVSAEPLPNSEKPINYKNESAFQKENILAVEIFSDEKDNHFISGTFESKYWFVPSVIQINANGKAYYLYVRNFLNSQPYQPVIKQPGFVVDKHGNLIDKTKETQLVYEKYELISKL